MKVSVNMPSGAIKSFNVSVGTTMTDLVGQIPELKEGEFSIRVKGKNLESDEVVQPEVQHRLELQEGDVVSFTPNIIGG